MREPVSGFPVARRQAALTHMAGKGSLAWMAPQGEHDGASAGQNPLMRYVELRRHTDNDDRLTAQGAADAEMIGRDRLHPPYAAFVSTGAVRATQMLEILRHAAGQDDMPITPATGLRSSAEDRWREAAKAAGKGAGLSAPLSMCWKYPKSMYSTGW